MGNFGKRTLTSIVYVLVMFAGMMFKPEAFGALFLIVMSVSLKEFYSMSLGGRCMFQQHLATITAGMLFILVFSILEYGINCRWMLLAVLPLLAIPISFLFDHDMKEFGLSSYIYTGLLYIGLPTILELYLVLGSGEFRGELLLMMFIIIWLCDAGAFIFGTAFGQKPDSRKLAPQISPKKSWVGFWGGMACGTLTALLLHLTGWMPFGLFHSIMTGVIISLFCILGDLVESMWKRFFSVKDSGTCIPGHGGMLDRFDSSLVAIPAAIVYLALNSLI